MSQKTIGLVLVLMLLAGCAGMSDETRTKAEGTATGVGVGAALGAGFGYLIGGKDGAIIGASAGAATGGIGGYLYGRHVANRKKEFAKQEDYLDALIISAQGVNEKTDTLRQEMVQVEAETMQLMKQYNAKQVQQVQLKNQSSVLDKKIKDGKDQLKVLQSEIEIQKKEIGKEQQVENKTKETAVLIKNLQSEITRLEDNKVKLEGDVQRLASIQIRPTV